MNQDTILADLTDIAKDVFDDDDLKLERSSTADDVEEWDSVSHISLVVGLEKHFKTKFKVTELMGLSNVGELVDAIFSKINEA